MPVQNIASCPGLPVLGLVPRIQAFSTTCIGGRASDSCRTCFGDKRRAPLRMANTSIVTLRGVCAIHARKPDWPWIAGTSLAMTDGNRISSAELTKGGRFHSPPPSFPTTFLRFRPLPTSSLFPRTTVGLRRISFHKRGAVAQNHWPSLTRRPPGRQRSSPSRLRTAMKKAGCRSSPPIRLPCQCGS